MYADLEKIEARGKRKKEKSKGFFSSFGNKDEPELDESQTPESEETQAPTPEPAVPPKEPLFSKREDTPHTSAEPPIPKTQQTPQAAPHITHRTESAKSAPRQAEPEPQPESSWKPLTGGKLNKAEEDILAYKKWLNKGYKSGILTKEQCTAMVRGKEIELGLRPPE
jgi:hypothetical protein